MVMEDRIYILDKDRILFISHPYNTKVGFKFDGDKMRIIREYIENGEIKTEEYDPTTRHTNIE
jgi:hypothetical protein